eukprot:gene18129-19939_t
MMDQVQTEELFTTATTSPTFEATTLQSKEVKETENSETLMEEKSLPLHEENSKLEQTAKKPRKNSKGDVESEDLNQEDIDAVQFLAAEFGKETPGGAKVSEQKVPVEIETIDVNVIEIGTTQGITNEEKNLEQNAAVALLSKEMEVESNTETASEKQAEPQLLRKRKLRLEDREFKCTFCDKSFSMKIAMEKHMVVHGAKLPWQCSHCSDGFMKSSDYKEHCNKVHGNYRPFPCQVCGKRLSNLGILKNHQGIHSGERPFSCQFPGCEKSFLTKTNLDDHERKHVNAREFECATCQKRFNLKGDLRQHEKVHKEDKPFRCEFCDMSFPRGPSLWRHRRTHTGEKPYQCDICEKRFSRMENCQEHRRIHTGERPLVCSVCNKTFRDSGNFSNHKKIHQEGYVPRKKRSTGPKKSKENNPANVSKDSEQRVTATDKEEPILASDKTDESHPTDSTIAQDVAFIVAPMQVDQSQENIAISVPSSSNESSYVQVGNFLLTYEMEAAFKQLMQQQGGSNEFVTLTMTDGKNLEFISDPSQAEALIQVAAAQVQNQADIQLQDVQEVIKDQTNQNEVNQPQTKTPTEVAAQEPLHIVVNVNQPPTSTQ